jgi:hypothetical protein
MNNFVRIFSFRIWGYAVAHGNDLNPGRRGGYVEGCPYPLPVWGYLRYFKKITKKILLIIWIDRYCLLGWLRGNLRGRAGSSLLLWGYCMVLGRLCLISNVIRVVLFLV